MYMYIDRYKNLNTKRKKKKKKKKKKEKRYIDRTSEECPCSTTVIITMMELCACAVTSTLIQSSMIEFINTTYLFKIVKFSNQPFSIFHYKIR